MRRAKDILGPINSNAANLRKLSGSIRTARDKKELSADQCARLAGISNNSLLVLENSKKLIARAHQRTFKKRSYRKEYKRIVLHLAVALEQDCVEWLNWGGFEPATNEELTAARTKVGENKNDPSLLPVRSLSEDDLRFLLGIAQDQTEPLPLNMILFLVKGRRRSESTAKTS